MSVTVWVDEASEEAIELGGFIPVYDALAEMEKKAGGPATWGDEWPALAAVKRVAGDGRDADPEWLRDVSVEAGSFLELHGDRLSRDAAGILRLLRDQKP